MVTTPHLPTHVSDLLRLLGKDPGRPRLTWYGDDAERIELSGAVLENWINKTTNLLVQEFDAEPGVRIVIDLPVHWRSVVWTLASWRTGATVVLAAGPPHEDGAAGDVLVTDQPSRGAAYDALVAVALPALARRFDGDLPPGAVDAAAAVMTYGDQIDWAPEPDGALPALEQTGSDLRVAHADLVTWALTDDEPSPGSPSPAAPRALVAGDQGLVPVLVRALGLWAADGSVVLTSAATAGELADDPARRRRLVEGERISTGG
ncbi:TIGR03089 family protein [Oerskovia flava]|uniref:TIGR03089 family protein n=1 Tax=Oerskovia flava TaxID=2986422 RepID=UPI00223F6805|nr:TIGR03089 family protein [Oerskovia sp. JB1-3-2]